MAIGGGGPRSLLIFHSVDSGGVSPSVAAGLSELASVVQEFCVMLPDETGTPRIPSEDRSPSYKYGSELMSLFDFLRHDISSIVRTIEYTTACLYQRMISLS